MKLLLSLFSSLLASAAFAQTTTPQKTVGDEGGLTITLGAERGTMTGTGESTEEAKWSPVFGLDYQRGRFFAGTGRGIGYVLVKSDNLNVFASGGYDLGRKDGKADENPRLVGVGEIKGSGLVIVGAGYGLLDGLVELSAVHLRSTKSTNGSKSVFEARVAFPLLGDQLSGFVSFSSTYSDRKHAQTYYGVTAAQALRSGNPVYAPKAGWTESDTRVGVEWALDKHWSALVSVGRLQLSGPAEQSPLFRNKSSSVALFEVTYSF